MISKQAVEEQLKRIGFNFRLWGRAEVKELWRILLDDEVIAECANGEYDNGFALLVVTNHRVLLIDKKPMLYLTVEDLRFDMISEFNYSHSLFNATIKILAPGKTLVFSSWNQGRLRKLLEYTQQRVLEIRQQRHISQQFQAAAAAQYAQLHAANHYQPQAMIGQGQAPGYAPNLALQAPVQVNEPSAPQQPMQMVQPAPAQYDANHDVNNDQFNGSASAAGGGVGAVQTQAEPSQLAPTVTVVQQPTQQANDAPFMTRLSAKRTSLGTYTRSKLPSFRRHSDRVENAMPDTVQPAQSGEVYMPS